MLLQYLFWTIRLMDDSSKHLCITFSRTFTFFLSTNSTFASVFYPITNLTYAISSVWIGTFTCLNYKTSRCDSSYLALIIYWTQYVLVKPSNLDYNFVVFNSSSIPSSTKIHSSWSRVMPTNRAKIRYSTVMTHLIENYSGTVSSSILHLKKVCVKAIANLDHHSSF